MEITEHGPADFFCILLLKVIQTGTLKDPFKFIQQSLDDKKDGGEPA